MSLRQIVTDKLKRYLAAHREIMPTVPHCTDQYVNNRAEVSHELTRQRERLMRRFKSIGQAQRFLAVHGVVGNLFRVGRHLMKASYYREYRSRAFQNGRRLRVPDDGQGLIFAFILAISG